MRQALTHRQYDPQGLSWDRVYRYAPSVFAEQAHHRVSPRYQFISTKHVMEALLAQGFVVVGACQSTTREPGRRPYTKHQLRFRPPQTPGLCTVGEIFPEVICTNAHDRSSMYEMVAGFWRTWCANGCAAVLGNQHRMGRVRHSGNVQHVVDEALAVATALPQMVETIQQWRETPLSADHQRAYAEQALRLRWRKQERAPIEANLLLTTRREEDAKDDLFTVYQKVEENLIQGGLEGRASTGRRLTTRSIQSVHKDLKLNKALWTLTETFATQRA